MTDQEPIAAAILTVLNAITGVDAYEPDGVPGTNNIEGPVPDLFVVLELSRNPNDSYRFGRTANMLPGYFLKLKYRGPNIQSCRELRRLSLLAVEGQVIGTYGPFMFNQEEQPIDDDADWGFSGTDALTFA